MQDGAEQVLIITSRLLLILRHFPRRRLHWYFRSLVLETLGELEVEVEEDDDDANSKFCLSSLKFCMQSCC